MKIKTNKTARNHYGLSQQQVADFTGVSRSHLAHHEGHRRNLPGEPNKKHTQLLMMMAEVEKGKATEKWQPHQASLDAIKLVNEKFAFKKGGAIHILGKIKKDLLVIQEKYDQTRNLIKLLEMMINSATEEKNDDDLLWLEVQFNRAVKKLRKCDESVQLGMRVRIASLEAIVNFEL